MRVDGWIWWLIVPAAVAVVAVVGQKAGIMNFRQSSDWRRTSGNIMGPLDDIFAPSRHEAMLEQERQTQLPAPAPAPGDPLLDLDQGVARLDVADLSRSDDQAPGERPAN